MDRAFLVVTARPRTSTGFMDRFLVTAEAYGIPTTVLNKLDDLDEDERRQADTLASTYRAVGYEWMEVSAHDGRGMEALEQRLSEGIHVWLATARSSTG